MGWDRLADMGSPRSHPNILAGSYLERAAHWRKDEARLRAALADPATLFVPVWRSRSVVITNGAGRLSAHFIAGGRAFSDRDAAEFILLGEFRSHVCFAVELAGEAPPLTEPGAEFHDLRLVAGELPADEAGVLAYARAMVHWREKHRFCGRCGSRTVASQAGHVLQCSDAACAAQQFPRIDPAVIVLVTDGERALLGRQADWPAGRYSTIAGFVEPGESLEDAVIREVREETGVEVDVVDYHSSQPWPFPSSLMLGFTAHASRTDIHRADDELEDARWLTRQQIAAGEVALPTTHSISFRLIEDWYDAGASVPLRQAPGVRMWQAPKR
jgi:NAD+ diphosphatase